MAHVEFFLREAAQVEISLLDMNGKLMRQLTDKFYNQGTHTLTWDVSGGSGFALQPGMYLITVRTGSGFRSQKFTVSD
jgi:flagellar hook assembly protein FlgD